MFSEHWPKACAAAALLALAACGKDPAPPVAPSSPAAPAQAPKASAKAELKALVDGIRLPAEVTFAPASALSSLEELAAPGLATKRKETVAALEKTIAAIQRRRRDRSDVEPGNGESEALRVMDLFRSGRLAEARRLAHDLTDERIRAALVAWGEAGYGKGSSDEAIERIADIAETSPAAFVISLLRPVLFTPSGFDSAAVARLFLAYGLDKKEQAEIAQGLALDALLRRTDPQASAYTQLVSVAAKDKPRIADRTLPQLLASSAAQAWSEVVAQENSLKPDVPKKGEFETTADFDARKAQAEADAATALQQARSERQGRFRGQLRKVLGDLPPWNVGELSYDADKAQFTAKILTPSAATVIVAKIPCPIDAAPITKGSIANARVIPVFDVPIDGELSLKKLIISTANDVMPATVDMKTGLVLTQQAADKYASLAEATAKEERAEAAKKAETARQAAAKEESAREARAAAERAKQGQRLEEYRRVLSELHYHQSSQCRSIVSGNLFYLMTSADMTVSDKSEWLFNGIVQQARVSKCL